MILATRHTGLVVRDLEKSVGFYTEALGLAVWRRAVERGAFIEQVVGMPGVVVEWVKLKAADGSVLELLQYSSHPDAGQPGLQPSNRHGCSHVAFTVDDVEGLYARLMDAGHACKGRPALSPDGSAKVMYCHDPDGIILELVEETGG